MPALARCSHGPPEVSSLVDRCAWIRMPITLTKKRTRDCSPPRLQLTPPLALAAEVGGERNREFGMVLVTVRKVSLTVTHSERNTGNEWRAGISEIISLLDRAGVGVLPITARHKDRKSLSGVSESDVK